MPNSYNCQCPDCRRLNRIEKRVALLPVFFVVVILLLIAMVFHVFIEHN